MGSKSSSLSLARRSRPHLPGCRRDGTLSPKPTRHCLLHFPKPVAATGSESSVFKHPIRGAQVFRKEVTTNPSVNRAGSVFLTRPTERGGNLDGAANRTRGLGDCSGGSDYRRPPARGASVRDRLPTHFRNKSRPRAGRLGHPRTRLGARWGFGFAGLPAPPPLSSPRHWAPGAVDGRSPQPDGEGRPAAGTHSSHSPGGQRGAPLRLSHLGVPGAPRPGAESRGLVNRERSAVKARKLVFRPLPPGKPQAGGQGATPFPRRSAGLLEETLEARRPLERRSQQRRPGGARGSPGRRGAAAGGGVTARNLRAAASAQTSPLKASTFQTLAAGQEVRA